MLLKEFKEFLKTLKDKTQEEFSLLINEWYRNNNISKQSLVFKSLKNAVIKNLKKQFKTGVAYKGALEETFILENPKLRILRGKWARKRGLSFQKTVLKLFNLYFHTKQHSAFCNINYVNRFAYQPYDIIVFIKDKPPILLECKAAGLVSDKNNTYLKSCSRRYVRALKNKINTVNTIEKINIPYYYVFGDIPHNKLHIVRSKHILNNIPSLYTKKLFLENNQYLTLPLDATMWDESVITQLEKLD